MKLPRFRPHNLNQALWRLLAAVLAPLLVGTFGLLALQTVQENRLAQTRLSALAQTLVQAIDAEFGRAHAQLEVLAASPLIDEADWFHLQEFAGEITRKVPGSLIVLVDSDGQVMLNTAVPRGEPLPNLWRLGSESREVEWEGRRLPLSSGNLSRQVFQSGRTVYSDLYYGVNVERPALSLAIPVQRGGTTHFALIFSFPPSLMQERLQGAVRVEDIRAALVDRNGLVVASNAASSTSVADRATEVPMKAGEQSGYYRFTSRDGVDLMGAWVTSPVNGFSVRVSQPHGGSVLPSRLTSIAFIVLLLTAMVASAVLASVLSRKLARPLRELGDDVLAGRAPPADRETGIAEIDLLANALRDGADAEHRRAEEQTRRRVAEHQEQLLRLADRQKDEFLATLAHELRNPLAPIRTAVELIRLRAPDDPVVERARGAIERQTMHLSHLVDDLLDVSRITLGRIQLRQEPVDLAEVASSAVDAVTPAATKAGLTVTRDIDPPAPWVQGDPTRLTQCVVNLLNNAVKFTRPGGQLKVRVMRHGGRAVVEVQDTGVGIAPENLERIFDLFVQERHSGHGGNTGLGIGLALTRRLVELHGGHISAHSHGLGQGSSFRIELPAIEAPAAARPVRRQAPAHQAGARVLVVDDNRDAAETLGELLGMSGYQVSLAHDGESAVRAALDQHPDVALLDIGLPDIDGYEACRRIRARAGAKQPLLVAVTGWGQGSDKDSAREAGFDAHLTKPVAPEQLMALLDEKLAR
ncbi:ATP-binding protein [Ramlibacter humi]|uniref:histidine kinase n=1 Tax=Ramlibacter humi TaxID=2530451 RepID=A0A4Z0CE74_9BURK|nr:ATP-binding protein [Ramlibacter humi]TFZ08908.1 hybrid sensor histidine kinase/response regulator [Ramlibacter humi]